MIRVNILFVFLIFVISSCGTTQKVNENSSKLTDEQLLDTVQYHTFQYFWDGAEPISGAARERFHEDDNYGQDDKNTVATGATGFGIMAIISAIDRGYVSKADGIARLNQILNYLKNADRFHGAWPHWMIGKTGKVKPFSQFDDGGDLVETSFIAQGLICVKQYYKNGNKKEKELSALAYSLWKDIDFDWYRNDKNVLYWHWSPKNQWKMNFPVRGFNECLIMYVLGASSPNHGISKQVYDEGWAMNGKIKAPRSYQGINLQFFHQGNAPHGGPMFWSHYSFLGLNPIGLKDAYGDFDFETKNHAKINYQWCVDNPLNYKGYGANSWGLTSSYSVNGYSGHAPSKENDLGVIAPTAALSSIAYSPKKSIAAMRYWYENKKDKLWGNYGFYDAFSETDNWYPKRYLGIDQGPIVVMMENYRTGLLWKLFMGDVDVQKGLEKLGFESPYLKN